MNALVPVESNVEAYRASTDAAAMCKDIVIATATSIQGRKYVCVEGWQAIAIAHGCTAGSRDVERVEGGVRAIGEVRRMSDGVVIATAEGFVGEDEPTWYGGTNRGRTLPKRADYAIRAMAQTRAISRACRSAFAHVVVMMNAGLATLPAEEVPFEGFGDNGAPDARPAELAPQEPAARTKLDGPHTSKTALRTAVHAIIAQVRAVESLEGLEALKTQHKRTINQALRDWPLLINGDPAIEEDVGLRGVIELKRQELSGEDAVFSGLVESMRANETRAALENWKELNGDVIAALDGEEGRRFEMLLNDYEAGLGLVETANA